MKAAVKRKTKGKRIETPARVHAFKKHKDEEKIQNRFKRMMHIHAISWICIILLWVIILTAALIYTARL
ncbi:MAG TPA: hypothetical protein ENN30_01475 [Candidatus Woesearchaeota archaeon]|nr:hypothetical protein [Candidatus Woesearchaeota archaeon]